MARENTGEAAFYAPRKNFFAVPPKGPILILTQRASFSLGGGGAHFGVFLPLFGQNDPRPPPSPISEDSEKYGLNAVIFWPKKFFRRSPRRLKGTALIPTYRAAKLLNLLCRIWRIFSGFCPIEAGCGFAMAREKTSEAVFYAPRKNFFAVPPKGLF